MIAYFDCFSGISGDMVLGALIDLGISIKWLKEQIANLPLNDFDITVSPISRNGIHSKNVFVKYNENDYPRNYTQIKSLINNSNLSSFVKETSLDIFEKIVDAESMVHGISKNEVHFHEVGAVDSIVDIVGTSLCIEYLNIQKVTASRIPLGSGFVNCSHGRIPVPAPATLDILKNIPVFGADIPYELVTPTGAAIIATLSSSFGDMPEMIIRNAGYGSGKNNIKAWPNLLRVIIGIDENSLNYVMKDNVIIIETCIDDMNPEIFGFLMDRLFEDGAYEVTCIPVFMKKNRPATKLQVLCSDKFQKSLIQRILSETTSLGVRYFKAERTMLEREKIFIETSYGNVGVKKIKNMDGSFRIIPEYEVCKEIALQNKIPIKVVYDTILKEM